MSLKHKNFSYAPEEKRVGLHNKGLSFTAIYGNHRCLF